MIKNTNRKQVIHCNLSEICVSLVQNPGIYVLIHAPISCSNIIYNALTNNIRRISMRFGYDVKNPEDKIFITGISDREAIFGGEVLLKNCIVKIISSKNPECLVVVTGCAAGVIGDDAASVCMAVEKEFHIPVIYIPGSGFMSNQQQEGLLLTSQYLYERVADNTVPKCADKAVVFGINKYLQTTEQKKEIQRLFSYFNINDIIFAPCGMSLNDFDKLNSVSLVVVHSLTKKKFVEYQKWGRAFAKYLNIPLVEKSLPFTVNDTYKYLTYVGQQIGREEAADKAVFIENQYWEKQKSIVAFKLSGVRYVLALGHSLRVNNPLDLLDLLDSVGMKVVEIIYLNTLTEGEMQEFDNLFADYRERIPILKENNEVQLKEADLVVTSDYRKGFSRQICVKRKRIGIGGCLNLLYCINEILEKGRYLKYE